MELKFAPIAGESEKMGILYHESPQVGSEDVSAIDGG